MFDERVFNHWTEMDNYFIRGNEMHSADPRYFRVGMDLKRVSRLKRLWLELGKINGKK